MTSRPTLLLLALVAAAPVLAGCPAPAAVTDVDAFVAARDASIDSPTNDAPRGDAPGPDAIGADANRADAVGADANRGDAGASQYTGAYVARACGPADGPALTLLLYAASVPATCSADPTRPSLDFFIHDLGGATLPPTPGSTITSTAAASNGSATECPGGAPPCLTSDDWSVTFDTFTVDGPASGSYTIHWLDATSTTGSFDATNCSAGPVICG